MAASAYRNVEAAYRITFKSFARCYLVLMTELSRWGRSTTDLLAARLDIGIETNYPQLMCHLLTSIVVLFVTPLTAQTTALKTSPSKMIQVGYYSFLKNDCSGGVKPSFKLRSPVEHGQLIVKPATLSTKRLARCGVVNAPALVVAYKADATFTGSVSLNFDVINTETGQTQHVDAIVDVAPEHLKI